VLVEGPAERILVPHFVRARQEFEFLRRCCVTWLEIGGSHAHRLKSLIEHLGLNTLIITDIDAKDAAGRSVPPSRGGGLQARNETLKTWVPKSGALDTCSTPPRRISVFRTVVATAYASPINSPSWHGTRRRPR